MRRLPLRLIPVVALVAVGIGPSAAVAASGACPTLDDGVTVVVDFQGLGGGTVVRCAPGDPTSGIDALTAAGFRVDEAQGWNGIVCRVDGKPGVDREDCQDMPPADAYWAYFHAERGGDWNYSTSGSSRYDPAVGSVEGWSFSEGGGSTPPRTPPPAAPDPPPEPEPEPEPEPASEAPAAPRAGSPTSRSEDGGEVATDPADGPDAATGDETSAGHPTVTLRPDPSFPTEPAPTEPISTGSEATAIPEGVAEPAPQARAAAHSEPEGSPWPTVAAVTLVALLTSVAIHIGRRRRSEQ